ncbi:pinopsin-like isoform X1 [Tachypleus tridentatus]|uniref:pinopsin-like isoform X1 n=1 Tax=Tachypleus tridentatus TaxID=6853 RepID=UPI003FCF2606
MFGATSQDTNSYTLLDSDELVTKEMSSHLLGNVPNNRTFNATGTYYYYGLPVVVVMSLIIVVIMFTAVVGNVLVILTVYKQKNMTSKTNVFLVNLAITDTLTAILNMPVSLITMINGDWIFGDVFCKLNGFTMAVFLICSIQTIMCIGIYKYISITRPFSNSMTSRKITAIIASIWFWSVLCAGAPLFGWNKIVYKPGSTQCGPSLPDEWLDYSHSIVISVTNYILPLSVIMFSYYYIFKEIHEHTQRMIKTSNFTLQDSLDQQKSVAMTLFLVMACFLLCWTPYVTYSTSVAFVRDKTSIPFIFNPLGYWCGYLNSACNPIIYALRNPFFRQGYMAILCGHSNDPLKPSKDNVRPKVYFRSQQKYPMLSTTNSSRHNDLCSTRTSLFDLMDTTKGTWSPLYTSEKTSLERRFWLVKGLANIQMNSRKTASLLGINDNGHIQTLKIKNLGSSFHLAHVPHVSRDQNVHHPVNSVLVPPSSINERSFHNINQYVPRWLSDPNLSKRETVEFQKSSADEEITKL